MSSILHQQPDNTVVVNRTGEGTVRLYADAGVFELPDPHLHDAPMVDWVHAQLESTPTTVIFTWFTQENLERIAPLFALLIEPAGACLLTDADFATSLELACEGRVIVAVPAQDVLTGPQSSRRKGSKGKARAPHSHATWAAFSRVDDLDVDAIIKDNAKFEDGFISRGITAWRQERHNFELPVNVSRRFPAEGDLPALADRLQDTFRHHLNPVLHNPFIFPDEADRPGDIRWNGIREEEVEKVLEAFGIAITGGARPGRIEVSSATSTAGLPLGCVVIALHPSEMEEAKRHAEELRCILECLLVEWDPKGTELGVDEYLSHQQGVSRSDYNEDPCHLEVPIRFASAHQLIAATETVTTWLERIAAAKPWITDPCYGRRCGTAVEDAPGIIAGLLRRFS